MKIKVLIIFLVFLSLMSVSVSAYFYLQNQKLIANPKSAVEEENQLMLKKIRAVFQLPEEEPSVITVVDREKLQDQEFFKKAENGDKVIVYDTIRKIILYRPSTGKIIDIAPLVFNSTQTQQSFTEEKSPAGTGMFSR